METQDTPAVPEIPADYKYLLDEYEDHYIFERMLFWSYVEKGLGFLAPKRITKYTLGKQVGVITRKDHPFAKDPQK